MTSTRIERIAGAIEKGFPLVVWVTVVGMILGISWIVHS